MGMNCREAIQLIAAAVPAAAASPAAFGLVGQSGSAATRTFAPRKFTFEGVYSELRIPIKDLGLTAPTDLSEYSHLVMDLRMSSPQRVGFWINTTHGARGMGFIAF